MLIKYTTITGKDKWRSFDADTVGVMQKALQLKVYGPEMTDENFQKYVWPTCNTAIVNAFRKLV